MIYTSLKNIDENRMPKTANIRLYINAGLMSEEADEVVSEMYTYLTKEWGFLEQYISFSFADNVRDYITQGTGKDNAVLNCYYSAGRSKTIGHDAVWQAMVSLEKHLSEYIASRRSARILPFFDERGKLKIHKKVKVRIKIQCCPST